MVKGKKSSDADVVLNFLTRENRPFSVQNMVDALQKDGVKKAAVERSLATLVEKGMVTKKEYGKAKIFLLAQDQLDLPDAAETDKLNEELAADTDELAATNARVAALRQRVAALTEQYTLDEAREKLSDAREQLEAKQAKLEKLGDPANLMSKEDKFKAEKAYYDTRLLWKKYRRLVKNVVDQVSEASGRKPAELYEDMDVETDEAAEVDISSFKEIPNPAKTKRAAGPTASSKRQRLSS